LFFCFLELRLCLFWHVAISATADAVLTGPQAAGLQEVRGHSSAYIVSLASSFLQGGCTSSSRARLRNLVAAVQRGCGSNRALLKDLGGKHRRRKPKRYLKRIPGSLKDPGSLLKDPGALLKDPGVLLKDPGAL